MNEKHQHRFNRQFDRLERTLPAPVARVLAFLRHPYAMLIRIPLGILLILGGIFSFLPVLGLWMLPLGLLLLAIDLPFLQGPTSHWMVRLQHWWRERRRKRAERRRNQSR